MRYVAGMDGGGTKTAVLIADEQGTEVHAFSSGPINYNGQDEESIRRSFEEMFETINRVCGGLEHCAQLCIGAAGVSNPTVVSRLTSLARECGYRGGIQVTGDHETALRGALDSPYGIILIAGTGSICYGMNESGLTHRAGGCGYLIDDEGSGYSIGRELAAAVAKANDGRIPPTAITGLVYGRLGIDTVRELVGFVHDKRTNKKDIAALAPLLSEACALGDEAALTIARRSAGSLRELVLPVVERLGQRSGNLALAGSVLLNNRFVRSELIGLLKEDYPDLDVFPAKREAALGAVLIALERLR
ncbi:N-acetylglucosamine kinase [Cohnella mopanensis]|uniref:N-acetylglucosamine kinase n=1 Tax=Cohnella mopanensis TaxID=2911966 RepID=UPI001EF7FFAD|nr:BadF/BadG/BcrA/BcrD ATPase family protein [Cohnella mopanensis]